MSIWGNDEGSIAERADDRSSFSSAEEDEETERSGNIFEGGEKSRSGSSLISAESETTMKDLSKGVEGLAEAGSRGIQALRTLFEQMKEKMKRKDVDKLEQEITALEDEKKLQLEKAGLLKHKERLEKQLAEIKSRKLQSLI